MVSIIRFVRVRLWETNVSSPLCVIIWGDVDEIASFSLISLSLGNQLEI